MASTVLLPGRALQLRPTGNPAASTLLEFEAPTVGLLAEPVRPAARCIIWMVASLVAACLTAMTVVPVDIVVTAPGRVVSLQPTVVVQPLETAILRAINVAEGQVVRAGDVLARLDPTFAAADVGALEAQVKSYQAEVDRLEAEAADAPYRPSTSDAAAAVQAAVYGQRRAQYRYQIESYTQKISGLQTQLARAEGDTRSLRDRLQIAAELESKRRELERLQVGSQINRLMAQDQRIEVNRSLNEAASMAERASRDLKQMVAERDAFEQQWRAQVGQELSVRRRSLSDAEESLRKAALRHQLVELRAEEDAVVLTIARVSVGSVMQSGDQFITLVPAKAPAEIEARIAGSDAGLVQPGAEVTVKFDTFPYVRYGTVKGTVRMISADSFTGDGAQRGAIFSQSQQTAPYYRARVTADQIQMHDVPGGFQMKPGMPVMADIMVGQRTVMAYLLGRVLPVGAEGMREP
jgi:hemolysin D